MRKRSVGFVAVLVALLLGGLASAAVSPDGRVYVSGEELHEFAVDNKINLSVSMGSDFDFEEFQVPVRASFGTEGFPWGLGARVDMDVNRGDSWFNGLAFTGRVLKEFNVGSLAAYAGPGFGYDVSASEMFAGGLVGVEYSLVGSPLQFFAEGGADYYFESDDSFGESLAPMMNLGVRLQY